MSPAGAALWLSLLAAATSHMLLSVGALTRITDAVMHGAAAALVGVATTVACQLYLRQHFHITTRQRGQERAAGRRGAAAAGPGRRGAQPGVLFP
jgi:hypothetical protein